MYAPEDPRVSFLRDFGMVDAPAVADAIKPGEFYGTVSAEKSADLASDVFLTWVDTAERMQTIDGRQAARQDPRDRRRALVRRDGQEVAMASTNPTPLSIPVIVEQFLPQVAAGHQGS